ncbi:hypothetical protein CC1G_15101 [Coprinopsis cinerea okayama7|uniref:Uncharacterized protein n=1 Tax=Coprinopsis cinerea (strain Okayama-7 / 130 / ATCC MYA-4618 / FGSC 9003) TaxID=240176 RepID=D6RPG3_COPC7|nr:hypothetical protein CC1G_15101 [Coprinopsis cinerea okayama7\|eukprot:XP_002910460.1 hypothetical protein CC1G_15101 [Coprinopsis cinerea okayama7\
MTLDFDHPDRVIYKMRRIKRALNALFSSEGSPPVPTIPRGFPLTGTYRVVSSVPSTSKLTNLEQTKLNFKPTKGEQQTTTT